MKSIPYLPNTSIVTTNLYDVDVANLTGDVTHEVPKNLMDDYFIKNAERVSIQIQWSGLDALDAVLQVKTKCWDSMDFICENTDETTDNPTQITLGTAAGNKIIHFYPSNYNNLQIFLDRNSITAGKISVAMLFKF
jgi:hypothetical protein